MRCKHGERGGASSISHMTAQRTIYSHTDTAKAAHDTAAQTAAVSSSLHRHKAIERKTASENSSIYSSAQAQGQRSSDKKAAICIHNILAGLPAADTPPPTPGFGGGMKMKLCQRVEVILFRPFSQPSSKNFGLNEVSLFHELF